MSNSNYKRYCVKAALMSATILTTLPFSTAHAQDTGGAAAADTDVVVVTGYRASLRNATTAKRNSTNFSETVFSEDIGKFPDLNMAEALQRVPGMVVARDSFSGEGTQIIVRALPSNFTQVTMNGNRIAMATDNGISGSSSTNRQTDLDSFPTGLFNRIDVSKTPSADELEGGIAGTVNLQNVRPFDRKGEHGVIALQGSYGTNSEKISPRLTGVWSKTWDKFGVLVGVSASEKKLYTSGYETLGYGDPNFNNYCGACDPSISSNGQGGYNNLAGSNQWSWANTVYAYTGNGLTPGPLTEADLLALNPGMTQATMKGALMPRLGRGSLVDGTSKNTVGLIALQYRPSENLRFNLDILGGGNEREAERSNMMLTFRSTGPTDDYNRGMIPLNMKVDANNVVTSATFANSTFFLESDAYEDKSAFLSVNAGMEWEFGEGWMLDAEAAIMRSTYERGIMYLKYRTPFESNVTATYVNNTANDDVPTITSNVDLNSPNIGWRTFAGQTTMQLDKRNATTKALHANISKEIGEWKFKGGIAYDSYRREIDIVDYSGNLRTAYAAAIPESDVHNYLTPMTRSIYNGSVKGGGFSMYVLPDFGKIKDKINYDALLDSTPTTVTGGSYNGAGAATIDETVTSAYGMAAYRGQLFSVPVRSNFGYRFQTTEQTVTAPSNINNIITYRTTNATYKDVLPSFNFVANVTDQINLRFAASKTMTRANPASLTSALSLGTSGNTGSLGNPDLKPFYSNNLDIGGEFYTGKTGYVGVTLFKKDITNFTFNENRSVTFGSLGVDYLQLGENQQQGLASSVNVAWQAAVANPSLVASANVNVTQPVNLSDVMKLSGEEFIWVQPLDNLLDGLGFTANYTHFTASPEKYAFGIPDYTYNVTGYYEKDGFSTRLSYVNLSRVKTGGPLQANNIPLDGYNQERHQIDLSASYKFTAFGLEQSVTLDATNLTNEGFKSYYTYENITTGFQSPGMTILLGWRAQY